MKKGILFLLLLSSLFADAQSLKEALYGGKLKSQPGTVIRKGDDLAKLHAEKLEAEKRTADSVLQANLAAKAVTSLSTDSGAKVTVGVSTDSAAVASVGKENRTAAVNQASELGSAVAVAETAEEANDGDVITEKEEGPKDNNTLLKEYMNGIVGTLKSEVLSSKKVKDGSYYVLVSYAIETDGQLNITDVFVSPENNFLQDGIKQRLSLDTPKLAPVLSSSGKARKVNKKYNFTLVKE